MICPMTMGWLDNGPDDKGFGYDSCVEKKCAWWVDYYLHSDQEGCALPAIALILADKGYDR